MLYKDSQKLEKMRYTKNLCLIIRGSQVQALVGPRKSAREILASAFMYGGS